MTIIAAIDRSGQQDAIVQNAASLADDIGESLHVIHVLNESEFVSLERTSIEKTGQSVASDRIKAIAEEFAQEALDTSAVSGTATGLVGDPAEEIVRYAIEHDAQYIVVGGRKRTPIGKAIFGSVTQAVLLDTDRPVIMVPTDRE